MQPNAIHRLVPDFPSIGWFLVLLPLVFTFFYAPLAFGGTTPETVEVIDLCLALSFVFWLIRLAIVRRLPPVPLLCLGTLTFLTVVGVVHLSNPKSYFDPDSWSFYILTETLSWLPGTVDKETTGPVVRHFGAMALSFIVLFDAVRTSQTRWFLIRIVTLAGLTIAFIGIFQRASGADSMLWVTPDRSGVLFFGAFRYNANAAAFLNLSWPAALALWLRSRAAHPGSARNSLHFCVFFFLILAVFVNTSKAGQILGVLGLLLALFWFWNVIRPQNTSRRVIAVLALVFLTLFAIAILPAFSLISARWEATTDSLGGRLLIYEASSKIVPDSGWFGTGPGTFRLIFPFYTVYLGDRLSGGYTHAHQDYLQTLIEWGYAGFAAWCVLIGGGLFAALKHAVAMRRRARIDLTAGCSALALLIVLLHALIDFPLQIPAVQWLATFYLAICWTTGSRMIAPGKGKSGKRGKYTPAFRP